MIPSFLDPLHIFVMGDSRHMVVFNGVIISCGALHAPIPDSFTSAHATQHWPAVSTERQKYIFPAAPSRLPILNYICFV